MSITSSGVNVLQAYLWYRKGKLLVNRHYQRKLVWTVEEKQKLIDSILSAYPLPLILFAEKELGSYEIIDGMQRLNALFTFIETSYPLKTGEYFDLNEFISAKLAMEKGLFKATSSNVKLGREDCAKVLNYQLAVTVFSPESEKGINDVFSRINSSGRQLSNQEKRQAGVSSGFSDLVRKVSSAIRGDSSPETLKLYEMPVISIDTKKEKHGYKVSAEKTFWCHHGILSTKQLRQSEDEDMIADFSASILFGDPIFARTKDKLDALYSEPKEVQKIESAFRKYNGRNPDKLYNEIKNLFSLIDNVIKKKNKRPVALRKAVVGGSSRSQSIKSDFYPIFMAFYELVVREGQSPKKEQKILKALDGVHKKLTIQTKSITSDQRRKNINIVKGLIRDHFVRKEPFELYHGQGLVLDFENSLNRSKIEGPRYEFKQGFLKLDPAARTFDKKSIEKIAQTACGMANISPNSKGYIHIGVADREDHARKIKRMDGIEPKRTDGFWIVGIDREAKLQNKTVEKYVDFFVSELKKTKLPEYLFSSLLKNIDTIDYHGFSVIRLTVESPSKISYYDQEICFIRENNSTKQAKGPDLENVIRRFELR